MKKTQLMLTLNVAYESDIDQDQQLHSNICAALREMIARGVLVSETGAAVKYFSYGVRNLDNCGVDQSSATSLLRWVSNLDIDEEVYLDGNNIVVREKGVTPFTLKRKTEKEGYLSLISFRNLLEDEFDSINPEEYYRSECLRSDGPEWIKTQIAQHGETMFCKEELIDNGAFLRNMNDLIDQKEKDHKWISFDNGNRYFLCGDVKCQIEDMDTDTFSGELRKKLEFFL